MDVTEVTVPSEIKDFPTSLRSLCVQMSEVDPIEFYILMDALPSTLTRLQIEIDTRYEEFDFPVENCPFLTHLELYGAFCAPKEFLEGLSRSLETFKFRRDGQAGYWEDENLISLLPPKLRTLHMNLPSICTPKCFKYLPPPLTDLNLDMGGTATRSDILALPRSLMRLRLNDVTSIEPDAWEALPRGLKELEVGATFKELDFSILPSTLRWFVAPRALLIPSTEEIDSLCRRFDFVRLGSMHIQHDYSAFLAKFGSHC
jgi:hypothetical protein